MDFDTLLTSIRESEATDFTPLINSLSATTVDVPALRVDELCDVLCTAIERTRGRSDSWQLLDKLLKVHTVAGDSGGAGAGATPFVESMRARIVNLCTDFAYATMSPMQFRPYAESFKILFGQAVGTLLTLKLKVAAQHIVPQQQQQATLSNASAQQQQQQQHVQQPGFNEDKIEFAVPDKPGSKTSGALVVHHGVRTVGGFGVQSANNRREMGHSAALMVKTRDSNQSIQSAALYAPAAPAEIALQHVPRRDADAPIGYMTAGAADRNNVVEHVSQRKDKLRAIFRRLRDQEEGDSTTTKATTNSGEAGSAIDRRPTRDEATGEFTTSTRVNNNTGDNDAEAVFGDIRMPAQFPRDDYGVKIGYYPNGVRFLRDMVRSCGGAVPLILLEQRIGQLVDQDTRDSFGDIRQFLSIHTPTFHIVDEDDGHGNRLWIVRLTDDVQRVREDPTGNSSLEPTWVEMVCPHCSRRLPGRNFARHENCRRCVGVQLSLGMKGKSSPVSPIMNLACAALTILSKPKAEVDDDDIDYFAECTEAAAAVPRFRHSSEKHFAPVLKALRTLRDRFLAAHDAASFDAVQQLDATDGVYAKLFRIWGENMLRLPIAWIDTGDVIDMCRRFTKTVHPPPAAPPRPGDPRMMVNNKYPGFLLAESGTDVEDQPSDADDELSDDEAPQFAFAPPVTPMETVMAAGNERDTKRLTYKLHTAPPVLAQQVIQGTDGTSTLQAVSQHFKKQGVHQL